MSESESTLDNTSRPQESLWTGPADLSNCEREPIHIPGLIQHHGVLIGLSEPDWKIVQVSANAEAVTGISVAGLLDQPLDALLGADQSRQLRKGMATATESALAGHPTPITLVLPVTLAESSFNALLHRSGPGWILELEPRPPEGPPIDFPHVDAIFSALQQAADLREFCQRAAEEVRGLTGFDRVMVYRFAPNHDGQVIAEAKRAGMPPFLDLHYPASDIPPQAHRLYLVNPIRLIPDVGYRPAGLLPERNPLTQGPLDMSQATLRSVSPLHIEYLQNMGVGASMSVSIVVDGKLWGLFACHHQSPHFVSYPVRKACEFLARVFAMLLLEKERLQNAAYHLRIKSAQALLLENIFRTDDLFQNLQQSQATLLELLNAQGVAVCLEGKIALRGETPSQSAVEALVEWLQKTVDGEVFQTDSLATCYPDAQSYATVASGLLALCVSRAQADYLLWFRPEVVRTVTWAGNPGKTAVPIENGHRLSPRKSFEAWSQQVEGTSLPWEPIEVRAAGELRNALIDNVLTISGELKLRAGILGRLNAELERSNDELDSFAYIASHDLKEPLRGIHNYAVFLLEDYAGVLDEQGVSKLKTLVRLSQRMEDLLDSLLQFSLVGRLELARQPTDLQELVEEVLQLLHQRIGQSGTRIRLPTRLPTVVCDPVRTEEIFVNLLTNALKYNDKTDKWIEIGHQPEAPASPADAPSVSIPLPHWPAFYVRDNGIGIDYKHFGSIFQVFKRLHPREQFGGGTGVGLTIVKKIIERHGGRIWLESEVGEGTTFYFTLSQT